MSSLKHVLKPFTFNFVYGFKYDGEGCGPVVPRAELPTSRKILPQEFFLGVGREMRSSLNRVLTELCLYMLTLQSSKSWIVCLLIFKVNQDSQGVVILLTSQLR